LQEIVKFEEMALLIISHDLAVISNLADRVAIMKNGKIVDQGKTEVVFTQLSQPYTKQILFDSFKVTKHPLVVGKNPLLDLRSVTKAYKTKFSLQFQNKKVPETVLNGVDFTLYTGECLGLVGESGCGKSTLARSIMGLETLNSGTITIDKLPIKPGHKSLKNFRQKLQIVFQDPYGSFNPRHRIQRIIVEPLYLKKSTLNSTEKIHLARKVITDVGLDISDLSKFPPSIFWWSKTTDCDCPRYYHKTKVNYFRRSTISSGRIIKK
jgi:ATPase components of various ABC-type transport systems, contain duplicated ATPase